MTAAALLVAFQGAANRAMAAAASEANVVDGRVTDLAGKPLGGVVVAAQTWERKQLGDATTSADGRFKIGCQATAADVTLIVEHAGFQRYAMTGFKTGGGAAAIALTRVIDADYLAALARETAPTRFRARAADLLAPSLGTTGEALPLEVVVPALPALRKPLRAWLPADAAAARRKDLPRDQDFALRLLALLGDPADDDLVEAWIAGDPKRAARPPRACRAKSIDASVHAWADAHFTKEGYRENQRRPFNSHEIVEAPGAGHAVVTVTVRYAHWGYSQRLALVRSHGVWDVRWVLPGAIFHGRD